MPGEELRPDPFLRGFVGHSLGAVLAELKNLPLLVRTRPCTALAIETNDLVDLQKSFGRPNRTRFTNAVYHRIPDGRNAGSLFRRTANPEPAHICWVLCLQGSRVARIQLRRRPYPCAGHRLRPQVLLGAIVPVSALFIPLDHVRTV